MVVVIALTAASVDFAWAHGIHVDSEVRKGPNQGMGPHKGALRGVGDYHLEFLVKDEVARASKPASASKKDGKKVVVYLYDIEMKPLSVEDKEGLLYLRFPGNVKKALKLNPVVEKDKTSHFEAEIDLGRGLPAANAYSFKAVVSLKIGKKRHNLRFSYSEDARELGK